jgi:hypothetical protein
MSGQGKRQQPSGALALPVSRFPEAGRPLYCVLAHMSKHVRGDAQQAASWLAIYADWPSGVVEVGIRRLLADSGMADHALRAALQELDKAGWAPIIGRGAHGVHRRQLVLCAGCQRGNSRHAGVWFSVAGGYTLEPARRDGQRGNSCHETVRELQGEPAASPDHLDGQAVPGIHRQPAVNPHPESGTTGRVAEAASLPQPYLRDASNTTPAPRLPGTSPAPRLPRRARANLEADDPELATSARW